MPPDPRTESRHARRRRWFAASGALLGWLGLGVQLAVILQLRKAAGLDIAGGAIGFLGYFTIWTNLLLSIALSCAALNARWGIAGFLTRPASMTGMAICAMLVTVTYHLMLRRLWQPAGTQLLADNLLHYVAPVLFVMFWWLFVGPVRTGLKSVMRWAIFPAFYLLFALVRGAFGHAYAYPFIDADALGYARVFVNASGVLLIFFLIGSILIWLDGRKR
ncbi:MAG: rane protein [Herbaspirillum sp.]|nr:rane protein [Herbaspirillum sp.]